MDFKNDNKINAPTGLDWVFNFGKYKDEQPTIRELLESDPSYVVWCCENLDWFDVDAYIYDMALEKDREQKYDDGGFHSYKKEVWNTIDGADEGDRFSIY